jgi:hypothetical protein
VVVVVALVLEVELELDVDELLLVVPDVDELVVSEPPEPAVLVAVDSSSPHAARARTMERAVKPSGRRFIGYSGGRGAKPQLARARATSVGWAEARVRPQPTQSARAGNGATVTTA